MGTYAEVEVNLLDRKLTDEEVHMVAEKFLNTGRIQGAVVHPLAPLASLEHIYQTVKVANDNGYLDVFALNGNIVGVLMYDIGKTWWSHCYCLKEMFLLTIDPEFKGFGRIALERLEELAEEHGCSMIETGSAFCLEPAPIANLYMKKGNYNFTYPSFVKINE